MATFTSVSPFANHITKYGLNIERSTPKATKAAADAAATVLRNEGAKYKIKGRSGGKFKLGAKVEGPYGYGGNFIAYVKGEPAGFWAMIEKGTKGHWIGPKGHTRGRRQRKGQKGAQALFGAGYAHPYQFPVWHPGTGGAIGHPWKIGVAKANVVAPKAFEKAMSIFGKAA
jgi:hypothetical protein